MSNMNQLSAEIGELKHCGEVLIGISETLTKLFSAPEQPVKSTEAPAKENPEQQIALEDIRAVLAEKSRAGQTAAVKKLLQKHGADKLSDVDTAEYAALLSEAEVL